MWAPLSVLLLAAGAASRPQESRPTVATKEGLVEGLQAHSAGGHSFYSFKGVPYAQPPVGPLRFQPPKRHNRWSGTLNAAEHGSICAQFDFRNGGIPTGSEDCLFANIYTRQLPAEAESKGLPVMVYIHGGAFIFNDGNSDFLGPSYLMDEEIVLVTFNYRLGVFGFFTTYDAAAPGNYGMLDQVLLLEWVQDNIGAFGGDPKQVTIFGQSAGGASVSLQVLSPLARGLFHRAITQSGSSFANFVVTGRRTNTAELVASQLNCSSDDASAMVNCIRGVTKDQLMNATAYTKLYANVFTPTLDPESKNPFIPKDPRILLETGNFSRVPWMSGMAEEEGYSLIPLILQNKELAADILKGTSSGWARLTEMMYPSTTPLLDCGANLEEEVNKVVRYYAPDMNYTLEAIARVLSGRTFVTPQTEEIRLASNHVPVYKYLLDHRGPGRQRVVGIEQLPMQDLGVTHTEDLFYLFRSDDHPLAQPGTPAHTMIRFMVTLWTSFARAGHPSSEVLPMPEWPRFTEQSQRHMRLNSQPAIGEELFKKQVNFWKTVRINEPWRHAFQATCEKTKATKLAAAAQEPAPMTGVTPSAQRLTAPEEQPSRGGCLETQEHPCLAMNLFF